MATVLVATRRKRRQYSRADDTGDDGSIDDDRRILAVLGDGSSPDGDLAALGMAARPRGAGDPVCSDRLVQREDDGAGRPPGETWPTLQ